MYVQHANFEVGEDSHKGGMIPSPPLPPPPQPCVEIPCIKILIIAYYVLSVLKGLWEWKFCDMFSI